MNRTRPPTHRGSFVFQRFTYRATSPPSPNVAAFMKKRDRAAPKPSMNSIRTASSILECDPAMALRASSIPRRPNVRRKSDPVPLGSKATIALALIGDPSARRYPLTTSFRVPSPPTATTWETPAPIASAATSVASPAREVRCSLKSMP
jgi:hypothetical protein